MTQEERLREAFVAGAKWWEFKSTGGTMWQSDQHDAWAEALRRCSDKAPEAPDGEKKWRWECKRCGKHFYDGIIAGQHKVIGYPGEDDYWCGPVVESEGEWK